MTYNRRDWLTAVALTLVIAILAACAVTPGITDWGDDFAGYINEGMAIADGRFQEQTALNYEQHPSALTREARDNRLVYVWGYPLAQALVYKLVGFDRVNYTSVIWYKAPLVISLALLAGVLYLLFRRRFDWTVSVFLALLFCVSGSLYIEINRLYSDLMFLFVSSLALLLMECYADHSENMILGLGYGIALWLTHETRLNGMAICAAAALGHVCRQGKGFISPKALWRSLYPYMTFVLLCIVSEHLWLAPATPNISDVGTATGKEISNNLKFYWNLIFRYFSDLPGMTLPIVGYVMAALSALGIVVKGFNRQNLYLTVLMFGTFAVLILLPYDQGLRYVFNCLPILLMYAVYGAQLVMIGVRKVLRGRKAVETVGLVLLYAIVAELLFFPCAAQAIRDYNNLTHWGEKTMYDVYTDEAIEAYRFIQANTPEDAVIAFVKPRALYMNTQRRSFNPGVNGHELMDADYYLYCKLAYGDFPNIKPATVDGTAIMDNDWFTLIRLNHSGT